jgi:hypothetical protein
MGLPGRKDVKLTGHGQNIFRHTGAKALDVPFLWTVETKLSIKAVRANLGRHLQKNDPGETATMGVGGVVIASPLHIQPEVDQAEFVVTCAPWSPAAGGLAIDYMANPALTTGQDHTAPQFLNLGMLGRQFALLKQLAGQFGGGIRTALGSFGDGKGQGL